MSRMPAPKAPGCWFGIGVAGPDKRTVFAPNTPLGMRLGIAGRPADGVVQRALDADLMAGFHLSAQQIKI